MEANFFELYLQISQRHLIVSIMNSLLQNSTHMDLVYLHYDKFMITYQTENKEKRLMIIIVLGQKYYLMFHKGYFLGRFFFFFLVVKDIDIASYADDSMPLIMENNIDNVIGSLEQVSNALFNWLKNNRLKRNVDKCHVLVCMKKPVGIKIGDCTIDNNP